MGTEGTLNVGGNGSTIGFVGSSSISASTPEMRAAIDVLRNPNLTDAQIQAQVDVLTNNINNSPNQTVRDARMRTLERQRGIPEGVVDNVKTTKTIVKAGAAIDKGIKATAEAAAKGAAAEAEAVSLIAPNAAAAAETAAAERATVSIVTRTMTGAGKAATAVASNGAMKTMVRIAGKASLPATMIAAGLQVATIVSSPTQSGNITAWAEAAGSTIGSYVFGAAGATAGTASLPGAGTAVGAMGGSMAGAYLGKQAGTYVGGTIEIMSNLYTAYFST